MNSLTEVGNGYNRFYLRREEKRFLVSMQFYFVILNNDVLE